MCGIVAFLGSKVNSDYYKSESLIDSMLSSIKHRGPDDSSKWHKDFVDIGVRATVGHVRLAIQDLTDNGRQPMQSRCGQYIIAFNGEIYNHWRLRKKLPVAMNWNGRSDTETVLELIAEFGLDETLNLIEGMFSIVLIDLKARIMFFVRDQFGEKPLYYSFVDGNLIVASELKAFKCSANFRYFLNDDALVKYLSYGFVYGENTIYESIYCFEPGVLYSISFEAIGPESFRKSSLKNKESFSTDHNFDFGQSSKNTLDLLKSVVADTLISDRPIGCFLSGGIDSTLIALLASEAGVPFRTYTIGFSESNYDESGFAKKFAGRIRSEHTEIVCSERDMTMNIEDIVRVFDEPFADPSQIPFYLIAKVAASDVNVVLTGDGGDEMFLGYKRHAYLSTIYSRLAFLPVSVKKLAYRLVESIPTGLLRVLALNIALVKDPERLLKTLRVLSEPNLFKAYTALFLPNGFDQFFSAYKDMEFEKRCGLSDVAKDSARVVQDFDIHLYLPDNICKKVDRITMSHSIEARAPFLNPRVFEHSLSLPTQSLIKGLEGKVMLRKILSEVGWSDIAYRPKSGFDVPLDSWIRGGLKDWVMDYLSSAFLRERFEPKTLDTMMKRHFDGTEDKGAMIWRLAVLGSWASQA